MDPNQQEGGLSLGIPVFACELVKKKWKEMLMFWGANAKVGDRSDSRTKLKGGDWDFPSRRLFLSQLDLNPDRSHLWISGGNGDLGVILVGRTQLV